MQSKIENFIPTLRTFLGTNFKHQGRVKKNKNNLGGVDCLGLIVCSLKELGINVEDNTNYSRKPDAIFLQNQLEAKLNKKTTLEVNDILLFKIASNPQHLGVITEKTQDGFYFIHAYQPAGKVVEATLDKTWQKRLFGIYSF